MSLNDYKKKELHQQVLDEPDTFVGGSDEIEDILPLFIEDKIIVSECKFIPAILKLFDEILVNSRDQKIRLDDAIKSKTKGIIPVTDIKIEFDEITQMWSIYNNGNGIDVAQHPTEKDKDGKPYWIVGMILGELLTSKNYNQRGKTTGGKNGFGAKLTNLFSTMFRVETVDHKRGLKYVQEFKNNMSVKGKPVITKVKGKPYTKISWITDFKRFGIESYSKDMIHMMIRRIYDIGGTTDKSLNLYFNKKKLTINTFDSYIDLYLTDKKKVFEKIHDRWEIGLSISETDKFENYSFVNGIYTPKGGKHVDLIVKQITNGLCSYILKKHKKTIPDNYIKNYMKIFINCVIEDPSFDSQSKERLITAPSKFGSKPLINDKFIKKIADNLDIVDKVLSFAEFKSNKESKKTDGVKKNKINVPKLDDANWAGTNKSDQTILILTEGDSAKTMAISGLSVVGRDKYGVFPLRGKVLNVKEASIKQITDNAEITNLKKILGLESGKEYKDINKLRYGSIMIMTDQDHDGSHIKGLVMLIFETLWPSLLKLNFIKAMITPIVKVSLKKDSISFYNLSDYEDWKKTTLNYQKWNCKYYKGLGTSTANEAKEYFKNMQITSYNFNEKTIEKMNLAFKKEFANDRKQWLYSYNPKNILNNTKIVQIEDFIDKELIHFSNSDTKRSIGSIYDGLKPSQRKILYCCFKRKLYQEIRVAQLAGYVSEHAAYHHGEASLQSTIIGMAQVFTGTNNINLLKPNGQFGSRIMGGADSASPRYIHTELNKIVNLIYPIEDFPLLHYENDDGLIVEPTYYVPVIPMVLVNGMKGIGTGFSTDIPQFNPIDVIDNIENKINGLDYKEIIPWYKGFNGTIQKISDQKFITKGKYDIIGKDKIVITELPVGTWTSNYKEFLNSCIYDKKDSKSKNKFIIDYEDHSTDDKIKFIIRMTNNISQFITCNDKDNLDSIERMFKLSSTKSISNIHLYEDSGHIKKYNKISDIFDEFYKIRFSLYSKRKEYMLSDINKDRIIHESKLKFIQNVIDDEIVIYKNTQDNIIKSLKDNKFPYIVDGKIETSYRKESFNYLVNIPISHFTSNKINELKSKIDKLNKTYDTLNKKTIQGIWLNELKLIRDSI